MNKATRMDQISAKFLEETADVLAYPQCKVINLSVKLSVIPECKIAKLKPLFTKRCKADPSCSLLPFYSNLLRNQNITNYKTILKIIAYYTNSSQVLEQLLLLIRVWCNKYILF